VHRGPWHTRNPRKLLGGLPLRFCILRVVCSRTKSFRPYCTGHDGNAIFIDPPNSQKRGGRWPRNWPLLTNLGAAPFGVGFQGLYLQTLS
jgi:hypothetical protein